MSFILSVVVNLIGLFSTTEATCDCPHEYCMKMPNRPKRCECCIYVYLGKRSSQPIDRYQDTEAMQTNKRFWPPFVGPVLKEPSLSKLEDYKRYQDKLNDKAFVNLDMFNSKPYREVNDKKMTPFYLKNANHPDVDGVPFSDSSFIFGFSVDDPRDSRSN